MAGSFRNLRNAGTFQKTATRGPQTQVPFETVSRIPLNGAAFPITKELTTLTGVTEPVSSLCFFDTETTGLSGGAGSLIFQAGLAYLSGDTLVVHQYFIPHPGEEPRLLQALTAHLTRHPQVVTYNGKSFDVPLLMGRYILNRMREPAIETRDLLHAARAVWKHRLRSFRLADVETFVLGVRRKDDLPGAMVPSVYRDYLMGRDRGRIRDVLRHNLQDVVSLAFLLHRLAVACRDLAQPDVCLALGRRLYQMNEHDRCRRTLAPALSADPPGLSREARTLLARSLKRAGNRRAAAGIWSRMPDSLEAGVELAKFHEHHQKDPGEALRITESLLKRGDLNHRDRQALLHRRNRLRSKLSRN